MLLQLLRWVRALLERLFSARERRLPRPPVVQRRPARRDAPRREERAPEGHGAALAIEYAPRADGSPDPGEVVWAWVPYEEDPRRGKDRPVLLLGRRGDKLVGVALTSKPNPRHHVEVGTGPWDREGRVSYAKVDRLLDLDARAIRREGASLDRRRFARVVEAVRA